MLRNLVGSENRAISFQTIWGAGDLTSFETQSGAFIDYTTALGINSVWACVSLISDTISAVPIITSNFAASAELASPDSYLVNGQPFWDAGQHCWFNVPNVQGIVDALEQAYQRGRKKFPDTIAFAKDYDANKVYSEMWRPLIEKLSA